VGMYNGYPYYSGGDEPGYLFYDGTKWCLSDSLGGTCIFFGNTPCLSPCPDLDPTILSSGPCDPEVSQTPTPTATPTVTPTLTTTPGGTPTPTLTTTPTPTPTATEICSGVGASITTGSTVNPSPTPTPTPTATPEPKQTISGATTYHIDSGYFDCGDVAYLTNCDTSDVYYVVSPILYSGGTLATGSTFNATINGQEECLTYVEDVQGSPTHVITEFNSLHTSCSDCSTPSPTPTPVVYNLFEECGGVPCTETNINYGEQTNPDDIISNWTRFSFFAGLFYPGTYTLTGLQSDDSILSGNSNSYCYTGSSKYLGSYNITMSEGENVGPVTLNQYNGDSGKFYFNTHINKFVVWYNVKGAPNGWQWTTFNPTQNTGLQYGNPTATRYLTTSTQWTTQTLLSTQYTVSGASNTVVLASDKITDAGGTNKGIKCLQNSGLLNGFYSTCGYQEYEHEVTLGSTSYDDDNIGLVLAAIKDDKGLYGPSGQTHSLTLNFVGRNGGKSQIVFNQANNLQAFTNGTNYNGTIWEGLTPFGSGNYNTRGSVRVKVIKSGTTLDV